MANTYCSNCGAVIPEGAKFCEVCGAPAEEIKEAASAASAASSQTYAQPRQAEVKTESVPADKSGKVASFWAYLGLIALFSLPLIGYICALIFAFAPQNKNIKNFARAWVIFKLVLSILAIVATIVFVGAISAIINDIVDQVGDLGNLENINIEDLDLPDNIKDIIRRIADENGVPVSVVW